MSAFTRDIRFALAIIALVGLFSLNGCSCRSNEKINLTVQDENIPFDYNKRNIYVFSVKALGPDNSTLYKDTLGLVCVNKIWHADSLQKWISWLYLTRSEKGSFAFNPARVNNSLTGILCNNKELFLHPPRNGRYTILEICPFPFLHFPLFIGKKWNWELNVGDQYCPGATLTWSGNELFKSVYEVVDTNTLELPSGKTSCYRIHAINTSRFGQSSADFSYSYQYGLIRLSYLPLDHTKIEFNFLTTFNDPEMFAAMFPRYKNDDGTLDYFLK